MNSKNYEIFLEQVSQFSSEIKNKNRTEALEIDDQNTLLDFINDKLSVDSINQNVHDDNPLKSNMLVVAKQVRETTSIIAQKTDELRKRMQLQADYNDKLIIIIFGKVNAGKSSFTNLLINQFSYKFDRKPVFFHLVNGQKEVLTIDKFEEGSIETTVAIQGVEIGDIVLLDSPGLHSVNEENGDLAKSYTDSADLILWLTSSDSPGQIPELNSLKDELGKQKILIPVISKSDREDEDVDEEGEIVSVLTMKDQEVRQEQQEDVYNRTKKYFESHQMSVTNQLKKPCSISVRYAEKNVDNENVFIDSGLDSLFENIALVYNDLLEAKINNVQIQSGNHLQEVRKTFKVLKTKIENTLSEVIDSQNQVEKISSEISKNLLLDIEIELPNLIDIAVKNKNKQQAKHQLLQSIQKFLEQKLADNVNLEFKKIFKSLAEAASTGLTVNVSISANFEDETISYTQIKGNVGKAATAGGGTIAGSAAGAAIGSIFPVVGTAIGAVAGGIIGSLLGGAAGNYFVEEVEMTEVIGVDSNKIEAELNRSLEKTTPQIVNQVVANLMKHLLPLKERLTSVQVEIEKV